MKVNLGHFFELMDRVHCQQEIFETLIADHPAADHTKALKNKIEAAQTALADLYQEVGALNHEKELSDELQKLVKSSGRTKQDIADKLSWKIRFLNKVINSPTNTEDILALVHELGCDMDLTFSKII